MTRVSFLLLLALLTAGPGYPAIPAGGLDYALEISFDLAASTLRGRATIGLAPGKRISFDKRGLTITRVSLDGKELASPGAASTIGVAPERGGTLEIGYEAVLRRTGEKGKLPSAVIDKRGIFLTGSWYPKPDAMCTYRLRATLPAGFEAVSEAERIEKTTEGGKTRFSFDFPHPVEGITFIATDRYRVARTQADGVEVAAYFFREDAELIPTYLGRAKQYIRLYSGLITPFPYKRFSIVENFLPTGYSMPTYTVLGDQVVRLPFIPDTSLGHEILHQWLGNLVYIDFEKGNWAEGLTTFLADHLYQEKKGAGVGYRKGVLVNFMSYVNDENDFPLRRFTEKTDEASAAIGYGKALMVFQMLKTMAGTDRFYGSLRRFTKEMSFRKASWQDIERSFGGSLGRDLRWFFHQWIDRKGLPEVRIEKVEARPTGEGFRVAGEVARAGGDFVLDIPVTLFTSAGDSRLSLHLSGEKEGFEARVEGVPRRLVADPDYEVARRLSDAELPPVVARLLGDRQRIFVEAPAAAKANVYRGVTAALRQKGDVVREAGMIGRNEVASHSLVILGADNPLVGQLYGNARGEGGFSVAVRENPWNPRKVVAIFDARSAGEVEAAMPKVFHYGGYSSLSFDRGVNVSKGVEERPNGIGVGLVPETTAVDVSTLRTLPAVVERVADRRIVYVGERHDRFSHHVMQLEILRDLDRRGKRLAIGMEMFQKPFQQVLDDFIEGGIDEKAFLRASEYFTRWGFDYALYRPILLFARTRRIPVVALNQRKEVVERVFRGGIQSLGAEEKKELPSQLDFSDTSYRERLRKVFEAHEGFEKERFDHFYEAQVVWDETMAESIDRYLRAHPGRQMVVLAGAGHLEYGSGIPKRAARRNGMSHSIILSDADLRPDIADFVLFPAATPPAATPLLMVSLSDAGRRVEVTGFPRDSVSEKAGIRVGDVILELDGAPVHSIEDVRILLAVHEKGDRVKVRVARRGLLGSTEKDYEVVLQ